MTAQQITRKAIATLCDADFSTRMPTAREHVMVEDLIAMHEQSEVN